ncbi:MAG: argininosuccinate synthase [Deltaproteobacteria bacterium]|jgi:argininosuccinate synthase|nr:argininosuccinate synthase [Deltaproteobacteria bacterium]
MSKNIKKVVLAYSGGMDTSVILKWLQVEMGCEVITLTCDLGQGEDLSGVADKSLRTGAIKAYVENVQEEFARDYIFPAYRAGAIYESRYLLGTSLARPLIAKRLVEIAREHGADAIAHGCTGKGNDQVRFELSAMALAPELKTVAPWRIWNLKSRSELIAFAEKHGIPLSTSSKQYSIDNNMLHLSFEGSELEDPGQEPSANSYIMTVPLEQAPDKAEYITVDFEKGDPVAVNGEKLSPAEIIKTLNAIGGKHAVGRIDIVENRFVGMKCRGVYETPGGTILYQAHRDLEGICLDREVMHLRDSLIPRYAAAIYNGFWYAPEREAIQALVDESQKRVTGQVKMKIYKGNVLPVSRTSPYSLFNHDLATFERDEVYNQADASGFIRLNGLRIIGHRQDLIK